MGDSTHVDPLVQFWDRPPDVIHAELCNPRRVRGSRPVRERAAAALPPELEDLLGALLSELSEAESQFISSLPVEDYPQWRVWLARYREMSPAQRVETVTGWFVRHVARGGPDILAGSAAQAHLARLQQTMDRHPSLQARQTARRQLRRILTASLRNFRNTRDRVKPRAVLAFYDRLRSRCLAILARRQPESIQLKALRALPQIRQRSAEALLAADHAKDHAQVRALLIEATGRAFSRRPTAVRELMARAGRDLRAKRGERRYRYWLAAQGLGELRHRRILETYPHLSKRLRLDRVDTR
jgi:hypothetical protein